MPRLAEILRGRGCSRRGASGSILTLAKNAAFPNGEKLYLDTARFGAADAPRMLVVISSTRRRRRPLRLGCADRLAAHGRTGQTAPGRRLPDRTRYQSRRLRLDPPRQRGQRRPQSQLRRPRQGLPEKRRIQRAGAGTAAARVDGEVARRFQCGSRLLCPEARRIRFAGRDQRGTVQSSRRRVDGGDRPTWSNRTIRTIARNERSRRRGWA